MGPIANNGIPGLHKFWPYVAKVNRSVADVVPVTEAENESDETVSDEDAQMMRPPPTARQARPGDSARLGVVAHQQDPGRAEYHLMRAIGPRPWAIHAPPEDVFDDQGNVKLFSMPRTGLEPRLYFTPFLPGFLRIVAADPEMRVRHDTPVVYINNETYVKLDDRHLVPAFTDHRLVDGENITIRHRINADWTGERRAGRPKVLFLLVPQESWEFTAERNRPKKPPNAFEPEIYNGHIVLNGRGKALKCSPMMPLRCSTDIEGWEMEALYRYDPTLCHQDFIDRMVVNLPAGKTIPTPGTLNHRRRRDRLKMRAIPWPTPNHLSYSDQQVLKEFGPVGVTQNVTWLLEDLTKEQVDVHTAITYGSHLERSGGNAQDDRSRREKFRSNLRLVRSKYAENSEEVGMVLGNIAVELEKMGLEFKAEEW